MLPLRNEHTTSSEERSTPDDLSFGIHSCQDISRDLQSGNLPDTLIRLLVTITHAEKGNLITFNGQEIAIIATIDRDAQVHFHQTPIQPALLLPLSIIHNLAATSEITLLNTPSENGDCCEDPYIHKNQPKSILCIPIVYHKQHIGMVYLESTLQSISLSSDTLHILKMIASQVALSLSNTQKCKHLDQHIQKCLLNAHTEREPQEKSAEKYDSQENIIETSGKAGLAEISTNVLHNVGNILNSVAISADLLQLKLRDSKILNIAKLSELLNQNKSTLDSFFTEDNRGVLFPVYL